MMYTKVHATPLITAGAYSSLDAVGSKMEFKDVCSAFNSSGSIRQGYIKDAAKQNALLYLVLFDRDFTETADNDPFAVSDADLHNIVAVLEFAIADYVDFDANSMATLSIENIDLKHPFVLIDGGKSLFGQLFVKTSTPTYVATNDLHVELIVE